MFFTGKFVLDLADYVAYRGGRRDAVIGAVSLSEPDLRQAQSLVDFESVAAIFRVIRQELNDPFFGLHLGEQITLMATASVDELMDSCSNVQEAFEIAVAFSRLISDSMQCTLEVEGDRVKVNFELHPDWALKDDYAIAQNLDTALLSAKNSLHRLTEQEYFPVEVNFYYPRPQRLSEHLRLFNCHLNFNQPVSSIVFHRNVLGESVRVNPAGLLEKLRSEAAQLLEQLPEEVALIMEVKRSILREVSPQTFRIEYVARTLNLTPRTLQRRLRAEGTTFKKVQGEVRLNLVKKLMHQGMTSLDEIAYLVGYSEASALVRAFRAKTGTTPGAFIRTLAHR